MTTENDFAGTMMAFREAARLAFETRQAATLAEIDRADWTGRRIAASIAQGTPVTRAEKDVHNESEYRERQRDVARLSANASLAEYQATAAQLELRWLIASKEAGGVRDATTG